MTTTPVPPGDRPSRFRRYGAWTRGQRRTAAAHFVRGLAYGTGATVAGLLGYGIRHLL
ncbi:MULTISPECIES: hypothetical protein [unclassified Streptomyces]|uniref:hypothetical protein n=1 Tax=unclassified Streptomyces TaxID=2593676 RepID=UPI0029668827|nr:hypothetical protein [Streptomyces sp. SCL15-4]